MTTSRQHRASFRQPATFVLLHHPLPFHPLQLLLPFTHLYRVWRIGYLIGAPWLLLAQSLRLLPKHYRCHLLVRFLQHWLPVFAAGKTSKLILLCHMLTFLLGGRPARRRVLLAKSAYSGATLSHCPRWLCLLIV